MNRNERRYPFVIAAAVGVLLGSSFKFGLKTGLIQVAIAIVTGSLILLLIELRQRRRAKKKLSFVIIKGVVYPFGRKPEGCPGHREVDTAEIESCVDATPQEIQLHLDGDVACLDRGPNQLLNLPCWLQCPHRCPSKRSVLAALRAYEKG